MMIHILIASLFLLVSSCSSVGESRHYKRASIDDYYSGSGVEDYFLPPLPVWANSSRKGECQRDISIRLLDFLKLQKSYALTYKELVELQRIYNRLFREELKSQRSEYLLMRDFEKVFYNSLDKTTSKLEMFKAPLYKESTVVWIDPWLNFQDSAQNNSKEREDKLRKLVLAEKEERPVVLLSICLSEDSMEGISRRLFAQTSFPLIGVESLAPFTSMLAPSLFPQVDIAIFFLATTELTLVIPNSVDLPAEVIGRFKIRRVD